MVAHLPLNSLEAIDVAHVLHPYTDARRLAEDGPLIIDRGKGIYVYDRQGKEYIEGFGGLWSVALGFSEERLVNAALEQLRKLPFYHNFAYKSHAPSIELAERLADMAPGTLQHVFFTNSGSEANDTVVKLVWYYNNALGRPHKKKIVSRLRGYHGITVAAGSLTGLPNNHRDFDLPIANILHTDCPDYWRAGEAGEGEEAFASRLADRFEELIQREGPDTIAALIGEPVMAAGGVIVTTAVILAKNAGDLPEIRHPADRRRSGHRFRPYRADVRLRELRHHAGFYGALEAADVVLPAALGHPLH